MFCRFTHSQKECMSKLRTFFEGLAVGYLQMIIFRRSYYKGRRKDKKRGGVGKGTQGTYAGAGENL